MTIRVDDQWGNAIPDVYIGAAVMEFVNANWFSIAQGIRAGGTYQDPVGAFVPRANNIVLDTSDDATDWPTDEKLTMVAGSQEQRIRVMVGGHNVGQVKRDVIWTPPKRVKIKDAN
jgi:hypothetical protein